MFCKPRYTDKYPVDLVFYEKCTKFDARQTFHVDTRLSLPPTAGYEANAGVALGRDPTPKDSDVVVELNCEQDNARAPRSTRGNTEARTANL